MIKKLVSLALTIADASSVNGNFFSGDIGVVILSVSLLHFAGFFVGLVLGNSGKPVTLETLSLTKS
jgi:hypothetical protein